MTIKNLKLTNFRNYSKLDLYFGNESTIFIGQNGAGKSNILEAIYLLSTSKSPRVDEEIELIRSKFEAATIKAEIEDSNEVNELMITMSSNISEESTGRGFSKRVFINGVGKRSVDFMGNLPAVIFWPSDINMITGSPSLRRWHLDLSLAQAFPSYKKSLTIYESVIQNRNRVLKSIREGLGKLDELDFWNQELIKHGQVVTQKRREFFIFINNLSSPLGDFIFEYIASEVSLERLQKYQDREIGASVTLVGPHRDDFKICAKNKDLDELSKFGSRGQQRMGTLAFKLFQLEFMSHILGQRPVLLLDDVFSELDVHHRAAVAEISSKQQTIIATVELENIPQDFLDLARILKVEDGKIIS